VRGDGTKVTNMADERDITEDLKKLQERLIQRTEESMASALRDAKEIHRLNDTAIRLQMDNTNLRDALKDIFEWARNWDSPFMQDPQWGETEKRIKALLDKE
jgi:hypothetical protein